MRERSSRHTKKSLVERTNLPVQTLPTQLDARRLQSVENCTRFLRKGKSTFRIRSRHRRPNSRVLPRSLYNEKIQSVGRTLRVPTDLKSTINLPKTGFPMKAGLPQNEPKILARWEEQRIYDRIREVRKGAPTYVLHDGPPYANGPIHLGTAMNKCLKDFIVKSKNMAGFDSPYVPGWDCHGLPIEIKVDQMLGGKKLQMAAVDVRAECRKYAEKFLDLQRSQFKRIGVFGRFDQPYSTMTPQYEAAVLG